MTLRRNAAPAALLIALACLSAFGLAGCGGSQQPPTSPVTSAPTNPTTSTNPPAGTVVSADPLPDSVRTVATFGILPDPKGGEATIFDAHNKVVSKEDFKKALQSLPKDPNQAIGLDILTHDPRDLKPNVDLITLPVGCYRFMVRWEPGYVGECIRRNMWHLNIHLRRQCEPQRDIFNAHACGWRENGPQFGLYIPEIGFCRTTRGAWTAIRDTFLGPLAVVGITGAAAYYVAGVLASVSVAAFAL